jgi:hypothetical protein
MNVSEIRAPDKIKVELKSLKSETYREYVYKDGTVRVEWPVALYIRESGAHCVFDDKGVTHYIPAGWLSLRWKAGSSSNHIDF